MSNPKIILYDDTCPMCRWYTGAFVKHGFLSKEGRCSFSEFTELELANKIDLERSRDEIPLIDSNGGATLYGIDSLGYLLGLRWAFIPSLLRLHPIRWFIVRLYKLISYNRRVIAAGKSVEKGIDCAPHFNFFYRLLYIGLSLLVGGGLIASFSMVQLSEIELIAALIAMVLLIAPAFFYSKPEGITYAGLMSTVILMGGLTLIPGIIWPVVAPYVGVLALVVMIWQLRWRIQVFKTLSTTKYA